MKKLYVVKLNAEEVLELDSLMRAGKASALKLTRARILLKSNQAEGQPAWTDEAIATALDVTSITVANVRKRFVEEGLARALDRKRQIRPSKIRILDGRAEARLVALACSEPPVGRARWTLQLLADKLVELQIVSSVSADTVGDVLKKTRSSRGKSSNG